MHAIDVDGTPNIEARVDVAITDFIDQAPGLLFLLYINPAQKKPPPAP
jgi:hypothetical protein